MTTLTMSLKESNHLIQSQKRLSSKLMKIYTTHTTSLIVPSVKTASMMKSIGIKKENQYCTNWTRIRTL